MTAHSTVHRTFQTRSRELTMVEFVLTTAVGECGAGSTPSGYADGAA